MLALRVILPRVARTTQLKSRTIVHVWWHWARTNNPDPTYAKRFSLTVHPICFCLVMKLSDERPPRVDRDGIVQFEGKHFFGVPGCIYAARVGLF